MIVNYKLENEDNYYADGQSIQVDFSDDSSFSYTFWNNRNKLPGWYSNQALDLLYISLAVFAADRLSLRTNSPDGWSRTFDLHIPVLEKEIWEGSRAILERLLGFLSGDAWKLHFRKRTLTIKERNHYEKWNKSKMQVKDYSRICMFSGGLDSFVGAIDLLEKCEGATLFVSHYGGGKGTKEFQDALKEQFIRYYRLEERDFHQYYAKVVAGIEDTTRTRSFMFFSHAIAVASTLRKTVELIVPENGMISLNVPSTFSRIGTSSTRTTHPHYMNLFQALLNQIGIPVLIRNPYQFCTKGEMLINCRNQDFLQENIAHTMSCSHPDNGRMFKETEARHCGYCLPCVIRQAAIKKAGMNDPSSYRDRFFESGKTAKTNLNSYRLGLKKFNPKYAFMTIQNSGSIVDHIDEYTSLYIRGMQELKDYLEDFQ